MVIMASQQNTCHLGGTGSMNVMIKVQRLPPEIHVGVRIDVQCLNAVLACYQNHKDYPTEWVLATEGMGTRVSQRTRSRTMQKVLKGLTQAPEASKALPCSQLPQAVSSSASQSAASANLTVETARTPASPSPTPAKLTIEAASASASQSGSPTDLKVKPLPKRPFVYTPILGDDELPDLDDPIQPQCTCHSTWGRTMLMCQACRLAPYEPQRKLRKGRHFLDVLDHGHKQISTDQYHNIPDLQSESTLEDILPCREFDQPSSVVQDSHSSVVTSDSDTDVEDDMRSRFLCTHKARVIRGSTQNVEPENPTNARLVTQKLSETPSYCSVPFYPDLLMAADDKRPKQFPVVKIAEPRLNIIEGVQAEATTCEGLASHVVKLVRESTTMQFEPPDELVRDLFMTLTNSKDPELSYRIYNTLETLFKIHPPFGTIPFTWSDLENIMTRLRLPYGVKNIPTHEAISNILALRLIVSCLETDLRNRSLASQLRMIKSAAYKWVSTDLIFSHVKQLIQWITLALMYGDFEDPVLSFKRITRESKLQELCDQDVPKVLPCLQKLLDLSLMIAKRPDDSAKRISIELVHMFRCLPSLQARHLFLTTITSPLLKFTLCQHLLEDQCGIDSYGVQCLQDILQADFIAKPPRISLTPPPTPSDDDEEDEDGGHRNRISVAPFQDESWEELTLLLLTVVSSYLATVKAKLRYPLWKRVLDHPVEVLSAQDKNALKKLPGYATALKSRIKSSMSQISIRTSMYLLQLECLADLQ